MTEAVAGMIKWAKEQPEVKSIYAETAADNFASMSVLKKNGFVQMGQEKKLCFWNLVL